MEELSDLTELQLKLLRILWDEGEATVRGVMRSLAPDRDLARSTVATLLSRLEDRGVITHREVDRRYLYRATVGREVVRRTLLSDLARDVFQGDVPALVHQLLSLDGVEADDIRRVRRMIEAKEAERDEDGEG